MSNVSWFVNLWKMWYGNDVSWFAHFVWITSWLGIITMFLQKKFEIYYLPLWSTCHQQRSEDKDETERVNLA
jgi:hypothetical protein